MRVELPDGEWAEFCSPRKVSDRRRRAWIAASADAADIDADHITGEQTLLQFRVLDLLIMCFLRDWSFDGDPTLEAVEDLDAGSKDALTRAAMGLVPELTPDFGDNPADPKATSGGSTPPPPRSLTAAPTSEIRSFVATS